MATAEINRGNVWADKEVKALLTIWGDSKIQEELDGAVCNKVVFVNIAKQLQDHGYERDWKQCRAKIKNLKTKYREVKDNNGGTGRGRKSCKFYLELDKILGHRPASVPSVLLDTGESTSTLPESEAESEGEEDESQVHIDTPLDSAAIPSAEVDEDSGKSEDKTGPPKKKQKREKKSKAEKALDKTIGAFLQYQTEAEERFQKREEEQWKKEMEFEEKRVKEQQEHEMRMLQMMGQMLQRRPSYPPSNSPYYDFNYHD